MVTRETAFRLKYADFEQPEPKFGQIWYAESGGSALGFIQEDHALRYSLLFQVLSNGSRVQYAKISDLAYAPTAADILPLLRDGSSVTIMDGRFLCHPTDNDDPVNSPATAVCVDMDEALALGWLEINEKK